MATRWVRCSVFALGAIAVGVYIAVSQSQRRSDTVGPAQNPRNPFNDNEASRALHDFLSAAYMQSDEGDEAYKRALERLRSQAEAVVPELSRIEATLRETDYPTRFALILAASELRHPAALPWLRNVALTRIPAERSSDPHSFSTVAEETILRTMAVDGIGNLARDGNGDAVEALFQCLGTPSLSIHRAAVQQLLQSPNVSRDRIVSTLPEDQHFLLDLRRIDVREAPQIRNPQQTLTPGSPSRGQASSPPSERPGEEPAQGAATRPTHNPPPTTYRG